MNLVGSLTQPTKDYHADDEDDEGAFWDDICPLTEHTLK